MYRKEKKRIDPATGARPEAHFTNLVKSTYITFCTLQSVFTLKILVDLEYKKTVNTVMCQWDIVTGLS